MLVKLDKGAAVNVDNLKYITVDTKRVSGRLTYIVQVRIDDNTDHPIAYFAKKEDAIALVKKCVKKYEKAQRSILPQICPRNWCICFGNLEKSRDTSFVY